MSKERRQRAAARRHLQTAARAALDQAHRDGRPLPLGGHVIARAKSPEEFQEWVRALEEAASEGGLAGLSHMVQVPVEVRDANGNTRVELRTMRVIAMPR